MILHFLLTKKKEVEMVVIDKNGIIYDVPSKQLESFAVPRWITKKDEINELTKNLTPTLGKLQEFQKKAIKEGLIEAKSCCNAWPNYCPNS